MKNHHRFKFAYFNPAFKTSSISNAQVQLRAEGALLPTNNSKA
jgi:hypothetical protein